METRKLPVKLTEDEITQRGRGMAKFESDRIKLMESKKAAAADFKAKIDLCGESLSKLSRAIETGEEDRDVECEWNKDFVRKVADLVRMDTGEVVETRPLDADELQEKLFPKRMTKPKGKKLSGLDDGADGTGGGEGSGANDNPEGLGF
jgi:hypothetical protein